MTLVLRYAARSDRGLVRGKNDDSVYAGPRLLAVADGMGGYKGGDIASKIVISEMAPLDDDTPGGDLIAALRSATENANAHLREVITQDPSLEGMGTTLTAMLFVGSRLGLVHVGDSRAYMLRAGQLTQITHDHTFVQALVDEGRISAEEASTHPQRSLILRALNGSEVDPDLSIREARVGDRYLLCSDGLSSVVSMETLFEALQIPDPQECSDRLVELALRGGGPDNVTCIVADVVDVDFGDDAPVVDGAAGGNRGQRQVHPNSAAARAALADPRRKEVDVAESVATPPKRRKRRLRTALILLGVLALLGGGAYGLWRWTQTQYFVAAKGDQVVIYKGVNTSLGPLRLYSVDETTSMRVADLQPVARNQVESGISADSKADARQILNNLAGERLPPCPIPSPTPSPSPSPSLTPPRRPTPTPSRPPAASASPTPTPSPSETPVPGEDCRVR